MESDFEVPEGFNPDKQYLNDTPKTLVKDDDDVTDLDNDEQEIEENKHELPSDNDLDDDNTENTEDDDAGDDSNIFDDADLSF